MGSSVLISHVESWAAKSWLTYKGVSERLMSKTLDKARRRDLHKKVEWLVAARVLTWSKHLRLLVSPSALLLLLPFPLSAQPAGYHHPHVAFGLESEADIV